MKIKKIEAYEILDSRGNPTVKCRVVLADGSVGEAAVPSGASVGKYEALELRDSDPKRFGGKGVLKAVENVNKIIGPKLIGLRADEQEKIDQLMIDLDGTENKSRLGANATVAVSMAVCRASAVAKNLPLYQYIFRLASYNAFSTPTPVLKMIGGGLHAGSDLDIQEIMIVPDADSFQEKLRMGTEIFHLLEAILRKRYGKRAINVGYEGGLSPPTKKSEEALNLLMEAVKTSGYEEKIKIILDVAASFFYQKGSYKLEGKVFTQETLLNFYSDLVERYPISAIEDPFEQEDWEGFRAMTEKLGGKIMVLGDDFLVTNLERIKKAINQKACNGLILKPNQVGTVSETIEAARLAFKTGWEVFVKQRSGETEDSFIADLAVGLGAKYLMAGAPTRSERVVKYNRLIEIERERAGLH